MEPVIGLGTNAFDPEAVADATGADVVELAAVAATTFPLACPTTVAPDDIAAYIAANLSAERFAAYLSDPSRVVLAARDSDRILGYAILIHGVGDDPDVARAVRIRPATELSKIYVLPECHGSGVAAALIDTAVGRATTTGVRSMWLGVNQKNHRAQRFYAKHGFTTAGTRTFQLGMRTEADFVLTRSL
ncbi:GNAT family N-acetyltransferase [Mycolicibacterium sp. CH28]|uniref:GNAT family N-acetyltransferase n=1 Tax=Mycolicibacterium sp. CH28 TaxID=2512237 RepID=UPI001081E08F|nr:GNAT family N-acetyltransferase [Mycolicibacterium sp. CH28]TGD86528.1 GNAT family N-acetyltransferase [Mycolicibacterium sp. CH28]